MLDAGVIVHKTPHHQSVQNRITVILLVTVIGRITPVLQINHYSFSRVSVSKPETFFAQMMIFKSKKVSGLLHLRFATTYIFNNVLNLTRMILSSAVSFNHSICNPAFVYFICNNLSIKYKIHTNLVFCINNSCDIFLCRSISVENIWAKNI